MPSRDEVAANRESHRPLLIQILKHIRTIGRRHAAKHKVSPVARLEKDTFDGIVDDLMNHGSYRLNGLNLRLNMNHGHSWKRIEFFFKDYGEYGAFVTEVRQYLFRKDKNLLNCWEKYGM